MASTIWRRGMTAGAPATGPVEQVGDQLPLLVGEGDREAHRASTAAVCDSLSGTTPPVRTGEFGYKPETRE
jgi:hypothetical protein